MPTNVCTLQTPTTWTRTTVELVRGLMCTQKTVPQRCSSIAFDFPVLSSSIDHLHNYGPGTRFGASQARFGCVVCVSHWSFRFSSALECRSAITVVFLSFSIEAGLVLHSSLMVFHGQVSSGSLPFVGLTGRTSASPTTRSYALSTSSLQKIFAFMLVLKSLWTLPSPVLWNRVRLDTSRKQVCHRCFLFTRMGPKWEYEARRLCDKGKAICLPPAVVWAKCWGHSLSEAGVKEGEQVAMLAKFVSGGFFLFVCFRLHLEKHRGCTRNAVCMRADDWETLGAGVQEARRGFIEQQTTVSSFILKYSLRRAMLQLEFRESKSKPEGSHFEQSQRHRMYAVCTVGGDDVWTLTTHETRLSSLFTVAYFSSKVLSETSNAPTWV